MTRISLILLLLSGCASSHFVPSSGEASSMAAQRAADIRRVFAHVSNDPTYGLKSPGEALELEYANTDHLGLRHLRFQQVFQGLKVWGHTVYAHINKKDVVYRVQDKRAPIPDGFSVRFILSPAGAHDMALVHTGFDPVDATVSEPQKAIFIDDGGAPIPAYELHLRQGGQAYLVLINGANGELLTQLDERHDTND